VRALVAWRGGGNGSRQWQELQQWSTSFEGRRARLECAQARGGVHGMQTGAEAANDGWRWLFGMRQWLRRHEAALGLLLASELAGRRGMECWSTALERKKEMRGTRGPLDQFLLFHGLLDHSQPTVPPWLQFIHPCPCYNP